MKIGLVRHFEVIHSYSKFMTSKGFEEWVNIYDTAPVRQDYPDESQIKWERCLSSDLPRALSTARHIYKGEIIGTKELREVHISPVFKTNIKLPFALWTVLGRMEWLCSHGSQNEKKAETEERIRNFISYVISSQENNTLLVTHGFSMKYTQEDLLKQGFKGEKFIKAQNGKMYIFKK
ncbi:histidine phosphatase family protein [Tissierella sp. MB52-C2]|uniref:phosphoglycerate mutase family protein n=1 Tax=Tissierella sp. MB52-C2 TaxID=3070999 RepID=UPI00280BFCFE|nr:histidine phosphatase family protein [Tissierella sp. MB52-C2]WMM26242.1 histidine phosphatase family protein [Tissierella sp. MB52-C2]